MKLFKGKLEPSCEYCEWGRIQKDQQTILCYKQGIVTFFHSCKKFKYAPLKRTPHKTPLLPSFSEDEFSL